ncbi:MAG: NifB/NifX family molybdenum-iron cluster-binding protein [Acidobacteria bacterium]|nr:NifB/NifX family molybdenum-iron cluster-binding protein [Acidobacteriota bacterium]
MIVAVCANEKSLEAKVEGCFGRTKYIFVADTKSRIVRIVDNSTFANLKNGSGIKSAEMIAALKVEKIAVNEIDEEAFEILNNSKIEVIKGCTGSVLEILEHFASEK